MSIVISLFDLTTRMVQPWAEAGYLCYCVDLQHPAGETREGNIIKVGANVMDWMPPREPVKAFFAFPPCTDVAVSGARWFKDKGLGALINALTLFDRAVKLAEWSGAPYMIENPVCTVSTYWRKPDAKFQPWMYGDEDLYTKETWLWLGNDFPMPTPERMQMPEGVTPKIWLMPPSPERANLRSATPMGFANAVFKSFHKESISGNAPVNGEALVRRAGMVETNAAPIGAE